MRSLPDIANERVKSLTSAISAVREQVRVKGFLGPSIREDDKLPSVGQSAARRAGIIVDENGKMRCPPGTPNANQFTDMQMSNCMVPSAETIANAAAQAASSVAENIDRAIGAVNGTSGLGDLSPAEHENSSAIKKFNETVLAKAPRWGRTNDEDIKKINDSRYYEGELVLTFSERQQRRKTEMKDKISNYRRLIESGAQTTESGWPLDRAIDPATHQFILTHTDDEILDAIEQTALKIAKARKREASVWAKGEHLEKYLTNGYLPMERGEDTKVGDALTSLISNRGKYEASVGAEYGSGVRPVYGFSRFTFWDDELKKISDAKNAKEGEELFTPEHYVTIPGKGAGGVSGYEGAFAGDGTAYGDMEFVLHSEVADRTTIHHKDSVLNQARGTAAVGSSDDELIEAIAGHLKDGDMDDNINRLLRTHVTQDFVNWNRGSGSNGLGGGQYTESNILGGFAAQDIKEVKFDATRLFPKYKDQWNPDGVDGAELIQKIEDEHLSTEQLLAAGFTMGEIEVARAKIAGWKVENAEGTKGRAAASAILSKELDGVIMAMEMERITALVKEKAPHIKVIFGSPNGLDKADPEKYNGGKAGDRIADIWGARLRTQLLQDTRQQIEWASRPDDEWIS